MCLDAALSQSEIQSDEVSVGLRWGYPKSESVLAIPLVSPAIYGWVEVVYSISCIMLQSISLSSMSCPKVHSMPFFVLNAVCYNHCRCEAFVLILLRSTPATEAFVFTRSIS